MFGTFPRIKRFLLAAAILPAAANAASVVIDTFDDGEFSLSTDKSVGVSGTQTGAMLGGSRFVNISTARRPTVVTSLLDGGSSVLVFDSGNGPAQGSSLGEGNISLRWGTGPAMSLVGFENFLLTVSVLQGTGVVHVGVNESSGFGTDSTRVPLTSSGQLLIPFNKVDVYGSLGSVSSIQLIISGTSPDFKVSVDSFQVVPEPMSVTLICGGLAVGLARRKRR